jgi:hypothetical protein
VCAPSAGRIGKSSPPLSFQMRDKRGSISLKIKFTNVPSMVVDELVSRRFYSIEIIKKILLNIHSLNKLNEKKGI